MIEKPNLTTMSYKCGHCHTKTYMKIIGKIDYEEVYEIVYEDDGRKDTKDSGFYEEWQICICPNCNQRNITFSVYVEHDEDWGIEPTVIHPPSISYKASPKIDRKFRDALETVPLNPAAAVNQFRVIIEMIWAEHMPKGTKKPRLRGESGIIKQLVDTGVLAGDYAEMADVLANIGDSGSHHDESTISQKDAEMAQELCASILEHVYQSRPKGLKLIEKIDKKFLRINGWRKGQYLNKNQWAGDTKE